MTGTQPLAGIRVLDFSWVWSGPLVGTILAEFGAEVIKVEHGQRLDNSRLRGRPLRDGQPVAGPSIELNPYYHQTNHGKRSITVNLKAAKGIALLQDLADRSDVVLENLTPGALSRAGLGYEELSARNPQLIMLSMSAAGQTGPLSAMRAYAPIMSSFCGLEALVGYPEEAPVGMMNFGYGDPNAAVHGLLPLLAALYQREESGRGCHVDMSQIEALLAVLAEPVVGWTLTGATAGPEGNGHRLLAPHSIYPAAGADRWLSIAVLDDAGWRELVAILGHPDWAAGPELATASGRCAARAAIDCGLAAWSVTQERDSLVSRLRAAGIAASPVLGVEDQADDPQFRARGVRVLCPHPYSGDEYLYRTPWTLSDTPPSVTANAPLLGADNGAVFGGILGLLPAEIETLTAEGVIA